MSTQDQNREMVLKRLAGEPGMAALLADRAVQLTDHAVVVDGSLVDTSMRNKIRRIIRNVAGFRLRVVNRPGEPYRQQRLGVDIDWSSGKLSLSKQ